MRRVIFKNPNDPEQPTPGVYRWFYVGEDQGKVPFYVGRAGGTRRGTVMRPSTLGRGISELQRAPGLSSDKGRSLDTDFIVGTAVKFLTEKKGYKCIWEHISDDPYKEKDLCATHKPILQDGRVAIHPKFKLKRPDGTWNGRDSKRIQRAEKLLYKEFGRAFRA